ncbi:2'-5' RNA ligase family protein [Ornithinimicrobium sp. CNJ-824]|uniref:2'-5' RNA ligase family protein n=1 Tax=Ornithinimicrobium sp. CNJ-824 TaxID=1904966 RepID=UPI001EDA7C91|nr:2'-5' RNA ligase family protein [Ornithinimicrobium sp. CNJ-824]
MPVPPLEGWVRDRTAAYDPGFVSADPRFVHAHVTALGPFVDVLDDELDDDVASRVAAVAAQVEPFPYRLARVATFPNGIVHLAPERPGRSPCSPPCSSRSSPTTRPTPGSSRPSHT